jgi:hypothetical protein
MQFIGQCNDTLQWLQGEELQGLAWVFISGFSDQGARQQIKRRLISLLLAALEVADEPPVTEDEVRRATEIPMGRPLGIPAAIRLVKRLRAWAVKLNTPAAKSDDQQMPAEAEVLALRRETEAERTFSGSVSGAQPAPPSSPVNMTNKSGKGRRRRGRPRGSATAASDLKRYQDWKDANSATGITKKEFVRERGLSEKDDLDAIERGRALAKRKSGRK